MKQRFYFIAIFIALVLSCEKAPEEVAVSSVTIGQSTAEMIIGETVQLSVTILPSDATEKSITWASSKLSVATVSDSGLVTAIAEGQSTITASVGGKTATCIITVSKGFIAVSSVTIGQSTAEMIIGETMQLSATIQPLDATETNITWVSSKLSVATVSDSGLVTAIAEGQSTITASVGGKTATCIITVSKGFIAVSSVTLNKSSITLVRGESEILFASIKPNDATEQTVSWSSSNTSVATVDQSGKVIAVNVGDAKISAMAGDQSATCRVTVEPIVATSVKITNAVSSMYIDETHVLSYELLPKYSEAVNMNWSSSDESILSINKEGLCKAVSEGSVIVTVSSDDMKLMDSVEIIVIDPYLKVGKAYISKWGFECTVNSISVSTSDSKMSCFISYTIKNITTDRKLNECTFSGITESGDSVGQYGFYGYVFPDESRSRSHTFETLSSDPFVKLVFSNPFMNPVVNPDAPNLEWNISRIINQ